MNIKLTKEELNIERLQIIEAQRNISKFDVIYDKYYLQTFNFIFKRTNNEQLTADICAQSFLNAMLNIKTFKFKGVPLSAWLYRIAINEVNQHYRKSKRERTINIDECDLKLLIDEFSNTNNDIMHIELFKALNKLKNSDMLLIELRYFNMLSLNQISEILGLSLSNTKVRLHRTLNKLNSTLSKAKFRMFIIFSWHF